MDEKDHIFRGYIVNTEEFKQNGASKGIWIEFPTDKKTVAAALTEIGLPTDAKPDMYFFNDFDIYNMGTERLEKLFKPDTKIDELNYLAYRISKLDNNEIFTMQAVIDANECQTTADAINFTANTDYYSVVMDISSYEELGKYLIRESTGISSDFYDYIDYEAYGRDKANTELSTYLSDMDIYIEKGINGWNDIYDGTIEDIPFDCIVTEHGQQLWRNAQYEEEVQESTELAVEIDNFLRDYGVLYSSVYTDEFEQQRHISDCLIDKTTVHIKDMIKELDCEEGEGVLKKLADFERRYPDDMYYIYQIKDGEDTRNYRFAPLRELEKFGLEVNRDNYELKYSHIFSGDTTLESIYTKFNTGAVRDFEGHSMSVSDIVVVNKNGEDKAYYCDSFGFTEVPEFWGQPKIIKEQSEQTQAEKPEVRPQTMTVLIVEPMQEPYIKEIGTDLRSLQNEVDGKIEVLSPFDEPVSIICNDESKINHMELNRAIYDEDGEMCEIIAGTFVIAAQGDEDFKSLSPEQIKDFSDKFKNPEIFVRVNDKIVAVPVKSSIKAKLNRLQKEQGGKDKSAPEKKPPNTEL